MFYNIGLSDTAEIYICSTRTHRWQPARDDFSTYGPTSTTTTRPTWSTSFRVSPGRNPSAPPNGETGRTLALGVSLSDIDSFESDTNSGIDATNPECGKNPASDAGAESSSCRTRISERNPGVTTRSLGRAGSYLESLDGKSMYKYPKPAATGAEK